MLQLVLLLLASPSWGFVLDQALVGAVPTKPDPSQKFHYRAVLDEKYELFWNFNTTHITFEVLVQAKGYVGFGLSPNGGMADSDIVIGWVKDGKTFFTDRHATGESQPIVDTQQDWFLIRASETGEFTTLTFVRKLVTCDPQDRPILAGTTKVIFSYSSADPTSDFTVPYHGPVNRGTKSLLLLDPPTDDKGGQKLPDNVRIIDFLNDNYAVPAKGTTYHSLTFKLPTMNQKHHMIRYEPVVQKGHERHVHHILLYACTQNLTDRMVGFSYETDVTTPQELQGVCENTVVAWAVGGTAFDFPLDVGHSFGTSDDPFYFRMETHYDNPEFRSDLVDSSGLRLTLTTELRTHDSGAVMIGLVTSRYHIIPPHAEKFLSTGYCQEQCLSQSLGDQQINVFAIFLHAHLLGRKLRTRHFRNGVELPPIAEDNSYDFNFQETRNLEPMRVLKKGDFLVNQCEYDSRERTTVTYGGLSTHNEMCLTLLWYYPRVPLTYCMTTPTYSFPPGSLPSINTSFENLDWTQATNRELLQRVVDSSDVYYACKGDSETSWRQVLVPQPNMTNVYRAPDLCSKS